MLTFSILASIIIAFFFISNKYNRHAKDVVILTTVFSFCTIWSIYLLIDSTRIPIYMQAIILFIEIFCFYYLINITNIKNPTLIHAKQEDYWDIEKEHIINVFKNNAIEKEDRIEVTASNECLFVEELNSNEKTISPMAISYLKKINGLYKIKKINDIEDIKKYSLHYKIFKKISLYLEKDKELFLDYTSIIKDFNYNLDFFIIHLWDKYSKDFNIGIGQLESITTNDILEQELINCLDNTNLKMMKLKGSFLQYKYETFKKEQGL